MRRYEDIGEMFGHAAGLDFSKDVFHRVALVSAGTHRNRVMVAIPTRHIYQLLIDRLRGASRQQVAARLYEIIITNPYTKSAAGYMLDGEYHRVFCKGGQWQISPMKANKPSPKFTHWTFSRWRTRYVTVLSSCFRGTILLFQYVPAIRQPIIFRSAHEKVSTRVSSTFDRWILLSYISLWGNIRLIQIRSEHQDGHNISGYRSESPFCQGGWRHWVAARVGCRGDVSLYSCNPTLDFSFPNQWRGGVVPDISEKVCSCPWIALYLNCWVSLYYYFIIFYQLFC